MGRYVMFLDLLVLILVHARIGTILLDTVEDLIPVQCSSGNSSLEMLKSFIAFR